MKRITNLKTGKNEEYIQRQWVHISALRDRLISGTEWTQNGDNLLTLESYILWSEWRRKVHDISELTHATPEEAEAALTTLGDSKPSTVNTSTVMRQKKHRMDISSLDAAKRDANRIVRKYVEEYLEENLPESLTITNLKYYSYLDWQRSGLSDFTHFPLLLTHSKIHVATVSETIDAIIGMHRLATVEVAKLVEKEYEYTQLITYAATVEEVIGIVKKMHGY